MGLQAIPHYVQGAAGTKEAAPRHNVSAKRRIKLKTFFILGGGDG